MKSLNKSNQKGFTIIEVLIVLAIAGIIMVIIFLAVPALQRNSRNTQRRNDVSHLAGLINEYAANHAGSLPTGVGTSSGQIDLSNEKWAILPAAASAQVFCASGCAAAGATTTFPASPNAAPDVVEGFTCDTSTNTLSAGNAKAFAITYQVETGGAAANACISG